MMKPNSYPLRILLWISAWLLGIAGLSAIQLFVPLDEIVRALRVYPILENPSGKLVFVTYHSNDARKLGGDPIPRDQYAKIIDQLNKDGVEFIGMDFIFSDTKQGDEELAKSIASSRAPVAIAYPDSTAESIRRYELSPAIDAVAVKGNIEKKIIPPDFSTIASPVRTLDGKPLYPMYQLLAGKKLDNAGFIRLTMLTDANKIKSVTITDVISGNFPKGTFRGKRVIVGTDDRTLGDRHIVLSQGERSGSVVLLVFADSLIKGQTYDLDFVPGFLLALIVGGFLFRARAWFWLNWSPLLSFVIGTIVAAFLETRMILIYIIPMVLGFTVFAVSGWRVRASSRIRNPLSGLRGETDFYESHPTGQVVLCMVKTYDGENIEFFRKFGKDLSLALNSNRIFHIGRTTYATWLTPNDVASIDFQALRARLPGQKPTFALVFQDAAPIDRFEVGQQLITRAIASGLAVLSDADVDHLFALGKPSSAVIFEGSTGAAAGEITYVGNSGGQTTVDTAFASRSSDKEVWLHIDPANVIPALIDHIAFAASEAGCQSDYIVVLTDAPANLQTDDIWFTTIMEARSRGFRVCLGGLGIKSWSLDEIRSLPATDMALSIRGAHGDQELLSGFVAAAVDLVHFLDRQILVTDIDSDKDLIVVRSLGVDYISGLSVNSELNRLLPVEDPTLHEDAG